MLLCRYGSLPIVHHLAKPQTLPAHSHLSPCKQVTFGHRCQERIEQRERARQRRVPARHRARCRSRQQRAHPRPQQHAGHVRDTQSHKLCYTNKKLKRIRQKHKKKTLTPDATRVESIQIVVFCMPRNTNACCRVGCS